ncbi:MAG: glycosyltransferase, partial [Deltaproteobacteria bacterium]
MKIAIVMTTTKAGGIEQTAVPYAFALRSAGHDVLVVMSRFSPLVVDAQEADLPLALVSWPWGPWYPTNWLHVRQLRAALRKFSPDAIVAHASKGLPQARAAFARKVPILTHSGTTYEKDIKDLLIADRLIVTSDEMAQVAAGFGADPTRMSVVPNFFLGTPVAHDYAIGQRVRIGSLGRLVKRKGFDVLVGAVAKLQARGLEIDLSIAGLGSQKEPLAEQAKALGVKLELPGWVENADKGRFLEAIDIFVCPSRDEPFGNIYIDALKYGLPIITIVEPDKQDDNAAGEASQAGNPNDPSVAPVYKDGATVPV